MTPSKEALSAAIKALEESREAIAELSAFASRNGVMFAMSSGNRLIVRIDEARAALAPFLEQETVTP